MAVIDTSPSRRYPDNVAESTTGLPIDEGLVMLKSIKIKNLRAISELEIDNLAQVNLLVGENNCGKTTILEALFFLIGATNPHLLLKANALRGLPFVSNQLWSAFFHKMNTKNPINITSTISINDKNETIDLKIKSRQKKYHTVEPVSSDLSSIEMEENGDSNESLPNGLDLIFKRSIENMNE